ncbi:MAG: VWA domain-containing protein [Polyangiaceae bacterium]|nr:VWA domain-containing protein [Polyangiaceae bacterium]
MALVEPDAFRTGAIALIGAVMASCLLSACSGDEKESSSDGSGGSPALRGDGGGGDGRARCRSTDDCPSGRVCHPVSFECVQPGNECQDSEDCPTGGYCEPESSTCLPGTTGTPCSSDANCEDGRCVGKVCGCSGVSNEQELVASALDIYFIFDRTASMGDDCDYVAGESPPVDSKACYATYALSDYLIDVPPSVDTRLAFQFMSLADDDCDGQPYATPRIDLTPLPLAADHAMIRAISQEDFVGGYGTHIEGALRGMADYTASHSISGREMIGVLMTDGDPNGCEEDVRTLAQLVSDHLADDGIRTFIIGMQGATDANLERLAVAGGAAAHDDFCGDQSPPCHYWNVGDGSGDAIADALHAIVEQAAPLPCEYDVAGLRPPAGETLDYGKVNVTLTDDSGTRLIGQVRSSSQCPDDQAAWYYDDPAAPHTLHLCPETCTMVTSAAAGARLDVVVGCTATVEIPIL